MKMRPKTGMALKRQRKHASLVVIVPFIVGLTWVVGCGQKAAPSIRIQNPWLSGMRVAVAPALNFSGSQDVEPRVAAELMASELSHVDGIEVLPVSRVLAVLVRQGKSRVESPAHAREIGKALGVHAIMVFAVTEYDPYEPPVVGIAAQLYTVESGNSRFAESVDPVLVSRRASPVSMRPMAPTDRPIAQTSRIYNAAHESTAREMMEFAEIRDVDRSAFGWRKYMVSQRNYLRFCCHTTVKELVQNGVRRRTAADSS